ncbi:MAG: sigma-70 family RNA polymerase sigma factor [Planctomycetes bacterium]|jgi:RNA polymerase sigma-70 factor (ECF subfamily)|nr:sigma-70 family RNA polymerase sigma factor [Planctomycetota bacterium]
MTRPHDFEATLQQHGSGLHRLAAAMLGTAEADDALQEVWLEALQAPPVRPGPLGGWLRTVLQHRIWKGRRERRRRQRREELAAASRDRAAPDHAEAIAREELLHRLVAAVHALEPDCRAAIWQRYFEGRPPRAIAAATGVPLATVKSRLHRGLEQLRTRLGDGGRVDWRNGLVVAFGNPGFGSTSVALWWAGVFGMAAGMKVAAVGLAAAVALGLCWWWIDHGTPLGLPPVATAPQGATSVASAVEPMLRTEATAPPPSTAAPLAASSAVAPGPSRIAQVRGRLVDVETRLPLIGDRVSWNLGSQLTGGADDPFAITDADGRFVLEVPAGKEVLVVTRPPRHVGRWTHTRLQPGQVDELGDWLLRPGREFPVRVVDADRGTAVADVVIEFVFAHDRGPSGLETMTMASSGADGVCTFHDRVPLVPCRLQLRGGAHELVAPTAVVVTADTPSDLTVTVRRRPVIRGVVVDERGQPLAGIGLSTQGTFAAEATTGADGAFTLVRNGAVHDAAATLTFADTGLHAPRAPLAGVAWGTIDLRLELQRLPPFPIEVVDDAGAPVEQFGVSLGRAGLAFGNANLVRQRGDHPGGRLLVDGVVRGATSIRVVPMSVELAPSEPVACGDEPTVRVVVARRLPCRVQVVRGELPVEGALVEAVHERAPLSEVHDSTLNDPRDLVAPIHNGWPELIAADRTGADGLADLWRDRSLQRFALRVRVGDEPFVVRRGLEFPADGSPLRVELQRSGRIEGRVALRGRDRRQVSVRVSTGNQHRGLELQPDGSFASPALSPGPWRVDLLLQHGIGKVPVESFAREVAVVGDAVARVEFDLGLLQRAAVRGRVTASGGVPAGLVVDLVRFGAEHAATHASAAVDADGRYALPGLWPGTYRFAFRLAAGAPPFVPALQTELLVLVGGENLEHDLHFVRRALTVRFVRADGAPARSHRTVARCGGARWPAVVLFAPPPLGDTLLLDPAPALPIEFGGWAGVPWSAPVVMPENLTAAEVTVVVPGS